jgi:hypothetical protein
MVSKNRVTGSASPAKAENMAFKRAVLSGLCAMSLMAPGQMAFATAAMVEPSSEPFGTLLIPLTPKLDTSKPSGTDEDAAVDTQASNAKKKAAKSSTKPVVIEAAEISTDGTDKSAAKSSPDLPSKPSGGDDTKKSPGQLALEKAEKGNLEEDAGDSADDTTLKGTVQIVADDTEYDQSTNCFIGTGNALALISGQNSKLEADSIVYNQSTQVMDARGNVRIYRNGDLSSGSSFKFNAASGDYLVTDVTTGINGTTVTARKGLGMNGGLHFKDGNLEMNSPVYMYRSTAFAPKSYGEMISDKNTHPDAYLPSKPSFRFRANRMVYEKYKTEGNLTVFGGRIETGSFSVPVGKMVMNIGNDGPVFPLVPFLGNNLQTGGTSFGPRMTTVLANKGLLSWAPMVQIGGTTLDGLGATKTKSFGLGDQVMYIKDNLQIQQAFGSTTGIFVASLKYKIYKKTKLQIGMNRYLDDGMFGTRRAKYNLEVYDNHSISKIPYMSQVNFRSSFGWYQDNPQLLASTSAANQALYGAAAVNSTTQNKAFKLQEQISGTTHPIFRIGDTNYGMKGYIYSGAAARGYSTGQSSLIGQVGPAFDVYAGRVRLQTGYTTAAVRGSSPFVFDQYTQGTQSCYVTGDYKFSKYLTAGGTYGYNLSQAIPYQESINIAVGPPDFKIIGMYNQIAGSGRVGFDVLYGQPIKFNTLLMKTKADPGTVGAI